MSRVVSEGTPSPRFQHGQRTPQMLRSQQDPDKQMRSPTFLSPPGGIPPSTSVPTLPARRLADAFDLASDHASSSHSRQRSLPRGDGTPSGRPGRRIPRSSTPSGRSEHAHIPRSRSVGSFAPFRAQPPPAFSAESMLSDILLAHTQIEVQTQQPLSIEEAAELKRSLAMLARKMDHAQYRIALEQRMRNATAMLRNTQRSVSYSHERISPSPSETMLSVPSQDRTNPSFSQESLRDASEANHQVLLATERADAVSKDYIKLLQESHAIEMRLLGHHVAVLRDRVLQQNRQQKQPSEDPIRSRADVLASAFMREKAAHSAAEQRANALQTRVFALEARLAGESTDQSDAPGDTTLQERCDYLETQHENLEAEYKQLQKEYESIHSRHGNLEKEHKSLRGTHGLLEKERESLRGMNGVLVKERDDSHEQLDSLRASNSSLLKQVADLRNQIGTFEKELERLREHTGALEAASGTLRGDHDSLSEQHRKLLGEHEALKSAHGELDSQNSTQRSTLNELEERLREMHEQHTALGGDREKLDREHNDLNTRFNSLREENEALQSQLADHLTWRISMEEQLNQHANARSALKEQLTQLEQGSAATETQLHERNAALAAVESELTALRDARADLEKQLQDHVSERANIEEQHRSRIDQLEQELSAHLVSESDRANQEKELEEYRGAKAALENQLRELSDSYVQLERQLVEQDKTRAELEEQLQESAREDQSASRSAPEQPYEPSVAALREELEQCNREKAGLWEQLQELEQRYMIATAELDETREQRRNIYGPLAEEVEALKARNAELDSEVERLASEKSILDIRLSEAEQQPRSTPEIAALEEKLAAANDEKIRFAMRLDEVVQRFRQVSLELRGMKEKGAAPDREGEVQRLEARVRYLDTQLEVQRRAAEQSRRAHEELSSQRSVDSDERQQLREAARLWNSECRVICERLQKQDAFCARVLGKADGREEMDGLLDQIKATYSRRQPITERSREAVVELSRLVSQVEEHISDMAEELGRHGASMFGGNVIAQLEERIEALQLELDERNAAPTDTGALERTHAIEQQLNMCIFGLSLLTALLPESAALAHSMSVPLVELHEAFATPSDGTITAAALDVPQAAAFSEALACLESVDAANRRAIGDAYVSRVAAFIDHFASGSGPALHQFFAHAFSCIATALDAGDALSVRAIALQHATDQFAAQGAL